jgi:hypothetical protein
MSSILKVDTIQDQSGNNIINENADTITIGASGDTITVPTGATLDLSNATQTGVGGANTPAFLVTRSVQSIPNNTWTKLQYDTEVVDTDSAFDNTTNYRFTVPSGKGGLYFFRGNFGVEGLDAGERAQMRIYVNGSGQDYSFVRVWSSDTDQGWYIESSGFFNLSAGDYVEMYGLQTEGASQNANLLQFGGYKIIT